MKKIVETDARLVELNDAERDAVAGGISLSFGNFGGAQLELPAGDVWETPPSTPVVATEMPLPAT